VRLIVLAISIATLWSLKASEKQAKQEGTAQLSDPTKQGRLTRLRQSLFYRALRQTGIYISGIIALGSALATLAGPFWPTLPTIDASAMSATNPFSVPFYIRNQSIVFDVYNIQLYCGLEKVEAKETNSGIYKSTTKTGF
jgi:hypothetical protein